MNTYWCIKNQSSTRLTLVITHSFPKYNQDPIALRKSYHRVWK